MTFTEKLREKTISLTRRVMMHQAEKQSFDATLDVRIVPNGKLELVNIGGITVGRSTLEPGWRWSKSIKPLVHTKSCEAQHFQYIISGTLRAIMDDGTEITCRAGDVCLLPKGHDAWVEGDEPVVAVDFEGMEYYSKQKLMVQH